MGYESNDYTTTRYSGSVYGAGADWTPNSRTRLDGFLEHRFFGESYGLNLNYRSRRTVWRLRGSRDTATTIEQPLTQRPATSAELLDDAFRARITDPVEREQAIKQFLNGAGLPSSVTPSYSFYSDQIYLSTQWTGSVALLGRRNTIELSVFWQENAPITTPTNASAAAAALTPFRQQGFAASFSHRLSLLTSLTLTANRLYARSTGQNTTLPGGQTDSRQDTVRLGLTHRLGQKTDGSLALRWQNFDSATSPYQEMAFLAALAHSF